MEKKPEPKPKKGLNEWVTSQLHIGNIIRNIINFLIFPALVFWIEGQFYNNLVIVFQGFLIIYFMLIPLMMVNDTIIDSQNAYLDGKWAIKGTESAKAVENRPTIWRRMISKLLIPEAIAAALSYLAFWIYMWITGTDVISLDPWTLLFLAAFIALIPTWIISHFWIKRYLAQDLSAFTSAMSHPKQAKPEPFLRYYILEHALPWVVILVLLNLIINLKGFTENIRPDGIITPVDLTWSVWITAFVLLIWMNSSAMNQVRADVHLGRVKEGRPLSTWLVLLLIIVIPIIAGAIVYYGAIFLSITNFSVDFSTGLILVVAGASGAFGRFLGILIGKTKEFKKIQCK